MTLTPTDVRGLLDRHGLAPRKSDGQNFLVDPNTVTRLVTAAELEPDDRVVEIGPGLGSMTVALADAVEHVTAIEVDAGLVVALDEVLDGRDDVTVLHADAMDVDVDRLPGRPDRVVANLPYSVATPLVLHVFAGEVVRDAWVMVQREVGERWVAGVGDSAYGAVSVKLALVADVQIGLVVPRSVFWPVPNVDSVMVRATRRPDAPTPAERRWLRTVVDAAFAQRRKTLRNNLRRVFPTAEQALEVAAIDPGLRAEALPPAAFVTLAEGLRTTGGGRTP
ncbi:16S rRNA (adenine(1518)-N(6)/adenine(1519)-N(6))-dimethyltransferase RsmA [Salsipaludibacter albus]|uniref:16S rRNA (adenine(1518)-N(6)/adenine(1519)-N(6))- dimethyltransferase RsmA n=1 Tax=Salsipaludibacter albus TaxID=2849650 RepID=UPI001EE4AB22|nr:16S rRNA (adenine(1518)-N(6)/adenine(1519)-N(6))-dimethyltransferase RsmA [Salsipaludibacter albus]